MVIVYLSVLLICLFSYIAAPFFFRYGTLIQRMRMEGNMHAAEQILENSAQQLPRSLRRHLENYVTLFQETEQHGRHSKTIHAMRTSYLQHCFMSMSKRRKKSGLALYNKLATKNMLTIKQVQARMLACATSSEHNGSSWEEARRIADRDAKKCIDHARKHTQHVILDETIQKYLYLACQTTTEMYAMMERERETHQKNTPLDSSVRGHLMRQHLIEGDYQTAQSLWHESGKELERKRGRGRGRGTKDVMVKHPFGFYHAVPLELSRIPNYQQLLEVEEHRQRVKELDHERRELLKWRRGGDGEDFGEIFKEMLLKNGVGEKT